jgi:two-component system, NarL family, sensor kinase
VIRVGESFAAAPSFRRTFLRHVAVGAALLVVVASVGAWLLARAGRDEAFRAPVASGQAVAARVVGPAVTPAVYDGDAKALVALDDRVRIRKADSAIERVAVWSADGVILYSDDPRLIGQRHPLDATRSRALAGQGVGSVVAGSGNSKPVLYGGSGPSFDVYAGTKDTVGRQILVETYFDADRLNVEEATSSHRIVAVMLGSLLVFGLLLLPIAYSLARRASRVDGAADAP